MITGPQALLLVALAAALLVGCGDGRGACLATENDTGTVVHVQKIRGTHTGRGGSFEWVETVFKVKRDADDSICVTKFQYQTLVVEGDKLRGPL